MSPTVFKIGSYRFFFFSREEERIHIHVYHPDGEAKFWLEPNIELERNYKLSDKQLNEIKKIIEENEDEIKNSWKEHFGN
ncbi:MAG: DUF4160 domain-containing protein [bacterium]